MEESQAQSLQVQLPDGQIVELSPEMAAYLDEAEEKAKQERSAQLQVLGESLAKSLKIAIDGRRSCGIEEEWLACDESYAGIDEANRKYVEGRKRRYSKTEGSVGTDADVGDEYGSTVFLNITQPYVDAAAARAGDMLLPTDDKFFEITPTKIPSLVKASKSNQVMVGPNGQRTTAAELSKAVMKEAEERAKAAFERIDDWLGECVFTGELRRVLDDAARIGSGVVKGPVPELKKRMAFVQDAGQGMAGMVVEEALVPVSKCISAWNLYPDPACGDDIHRGDFIWERDDITAKGLRALIGVEGYLDDQIELVLREGPKSAIEETGRENKTDINESQPFDIWYYTGTIGQAEAELVGCECGEFETISVVVTMVNSRVIKVAKNVNDYGRFPYDIMPWKRKMGMPWGSGVANAVSIPQRIINGAMRELMNNVGLSSGPQTVLLDGVIESIDGTNKIRPRQVWTAKQGSDLQDIARAMMFFNVPSMQSELLALVQFALKMAEDVTGLPAILQGQMGKAPDTLGGMQMLSNNASGVLRRIARMFDNSITVPHIQRYYEYLMMYGENDEEKGDFSIIARGSSALVERELQAQTMVNVLQLTLNPAFGLSPVKGAEEYLRSQKINPSNLKMSEEEIQRLQQAQQGQSDPRIEVATLNAKVAQMKIAAEQQNKQLDREQELLIAQMDAKLAEAGLTVDQQKVLSEVKAQLADTAMKLRAQREMQMQDHAQQTIEPPVEPAGRAENGKAFIH